MFQESLKAYNVHSSIVMTLEGSCTKYEETAYQGWYINPLLHNSAFWRFWNIMYLKILWKMEHLLFESKCSIFHNIIKRIQNLL